MRHIECSVALVQCEPLARVSVNGLLKHPTLGPRAGWKVIDIQEFPGQGILDS